MSNKQTKQTDQIIMKNRDYHKTIEIQALHDNKLLFSSPRSRNFRIVAFITMLSMGSSE